jgi:peptidoglycan-associated lipoprotein
MIQSNKFGLTAVVLSMVLAGCSSAPTDESTDIEDTSVQTGQVDTSAIDDSAMDAATAADTVFYFDYDKALLKPESRAALLEHAASLNSSPRSVRLEGHADERGTREYNMALGERRANAVKEFMVLQGVSAGLIEVISYGEERAASYGSNDSAWSMNRRVELK